MRAFRIIARRASALTLALTLCGLSAVARQPSAVLRGRVVDQLGGVVVGATVKAVDADGAEKTTTTTGDGSYAIHGLAPGLYTVRVEAAGFAAHEEAGVELAAGPKRLGDIRLAVSLKDEEVNVSSGGGLSVDPENSASALVLKGDDLDVLSDDPDQLAEDLRAIAGPADGPNGAQFFVDGFGGGRVPPKSSIREVRINANPFAAEQEFFGLGRVDIITKPGADKLRGSAFVNFNDESLNARNPFALRRAPFQSRLYGANLSGPVVAGRASFFVDFERRDIDENAFVNAVVLDPSLTPRSLRQVVLAPQRRTSLSGRADYQLNANHTLVARYSRLRQSFDNVGVGGLSLASRAHHTSRTEDTLQLIETAVLSPAMLNETRFQFTRSRREQAGDNAEPAVVVQDAFAGGGSQVGPAFNAATRYELQNTTIWTRGPRTLKLGGRLRGARVTDFAPANFGGTYLFTSLGQYADVLRGVPGARPAQFTLAGGDPESDIGQTDVSAFVQDDWRVRHDLTLSYGLRVEWQTNLAAGVKFAPRVAVAWAPGSTAQTKRPQTVVRSGFGLYYFRVEDSLFLNARRFDGVSQRQFIVTGPSFYPRVPTADELGASVPQTTRRVADGLSTPYVYYAAFSVERQLPRGTTVSATYIYELYRQLLRSRNVNAPLPGTYDPADPSSGVRPFGNVGHIFQFESGGVGTDHTLFINLRSQLAKRVSLFGMLALSRQRGDAESPYEFPADSYDMSGEYGQTANDPHVFGHVGATVNGPWGLTFSPLMRGVSATAFNITTGVDSNGDGVFTERPAFAEDLGKPGVVLTPFGAFDPNPAPGRPIIPRNHGTNPTFFNLNLRVARTFKFGAAKGGTAKGGRPAEKPYSLTFAVFAQNLFNRTNPAGRIGNLNSPLFGQPISTLGIPRRVDLSLRFNF
ncbi:MAG TPA: carboxypeptidase regulatory-like domain-containing protein [Pyrinomonadaceae bacterium]|nr:carboxypeptidase regulatory-like domain-containing protein [Pyrinomonadaceae bacterium]